MQRRSVRAAGIFVLFVVTGCAKADRSAPPSREPMPQNAPEQAPTALPSSAAEPTPATPAPGGVEPDKEQSRDRLKQGTTDTAEPQTLAEAEKALDQAKGNLDTLLGGAKGRAAGGGATPLSAGDTRCGDACKAMSSLRRAASAVCRLAGDANQRCTKAKGIVKDSESRVSACKCES